ncbi:hypothetical protein RJ639_024645 [Escallonia herrerae]|uniref:Protein TIFY n=1 Tax=Escallonia herrerae TaxID=1293975 RepID=A0AA88UZX2_9ASTE|nr:hypothetical protein RJ639_024645 [Escallonia herrerae]
MRRPSWNKSQAIQQVISLKTLLEPPPPPDSDAGARRSRYIPHPENPLLVANKGTSADTEASVSAEESVPDRRKDSDTPVLSGDLSYPLVAPDIDSVSPSLLCIRSMQLPPMVVDDGDALVADSVLNIEFSLNGHRTTGVTDVPVTSVGQMTIFYSGKVNVYDDMPADKARAIMQLAASPLHQEAPNYGITTGQPLPCHLRATSVKVGPESAVLLQTLQAGDIGSKASSPTSVLYSLKFYISEFV